MNRTVFYQTVEPGGFFRTGRFFDTHTTTHTERRGEREGTAIVPLRKPPLLCSGILSATSLPITTKPPKNPNPSAITTNAATTHTEGERETQTSQTPTNCHLNPSVNRATVVLIEQSPNVSFLWFSKRIEFSSEKRKSGNGFQKKMRIES